MNVCGLSDWKLAGGILGSHFKRFDIILLQEAWSADGDEFNLNGYEFYTFPRKYRHKLSVRNSGGLGIFVNQRLTKGVQILKHHGEILVWLKLKQNSFGLANDVYIANVYIIPENSVHLCHDASDMLREDLYGFSPHSDFLICRDYNAHTNVLPDYLLDEYLCGDDGDIPFLESANNMPSELLRAIAGNKQLERYSKDTSRLNKHGANRLELCQTGSLLIINGRLGSDKGIGEFLRVDTTGCSTVDYMLCNPDLFSQIIYFDIENKVPESDHCGLAISIKGNAPIKDNAADNKSAWTCHKKYLWLTCDLQNLQVMMTDNQSLKFRQAVINSLVELEDTNTVASHFSDKQRVTWRQGIKREMTCTVYVALVWNIIYWICIWMPLFVI